MIEIKHNALSDDLGTDVIAIDEQGNILARASTEEACRRAAPDAAEYHNMNSLWDNTGSGHGGGVDYAAAEAAVAEEPAIDPVVAVEAEAPISNGLEPEAPVEPEEPVVAEPEPTASRKRKPASGK